MGGEPTFVSIDDYDAPEWNTAAVGGNKQARAETLIRRLQARFAPGGFLHYGQGKWYPGESLPRWAFALYWRKDGKPIWQRPVADRRRRRERGGDATRTRRRSPAKSPSRLGIEPDYVIPAYEDAPYWLLRESALPVNVDPSDPKIDDPEERARMVRTFDHGLSRPTGFVLPVQRWNAEAKPAWRSERWPLDAASSFSCPATRRSACACR